MARLTIDDTMDTFDLIENEELSVLRIPDKYPECNYEYEEMNSDIVPYLICLIYNTSFSISKEYKHAKQDKDCYFKYEFRGRE